MGDRSWIEKEGDRRYLQEQAREAKGEYEKLNELAQFTGRDDLRQAANAALDRAEHLRHEADNCY